jgi:D-proline reductase (dithiol) PrdB
MTATSEPHEQLRSKLWHTINERYPGSMITKDDDVPLAPLRKPLAESRLTFVSTAGVQPKGTLPFDTAHPIGDYSFRRVPSRSKPADLEIHQIKYPTIGAHRDLNVIFPIERLQELVVEGVLGGLTESFFSFIGYNMDPARVEREQSVRIADAVETDGPDCVLMSPA